MHSFEPAEQSAHPARLSADPALPTVFTRADAVAAGLSRNQIEHRIGRQWQPLRRGAYCLSSSWQTASPAGRHLLSAVAATLTHACDESITISHLTAALAWDLPCPSPITWPVCLTTRPGHRHPEALAPRPARRRAPTRIQVATMRRQDRTRLRGTWVTTPARTAADCLRHCEPQVAVPIADAILFRGLATLAELDDVLAFQDAWPYAARARRSRRIVAPRESWLESASAVAFDLAGLDPPASQVEIYDRRGTFVARVDFAWIRDGVIGEADGLAKYGLSWTAGAQAGRSEADGRPAMPGTSAANGKREVDGEPAVHSEPAVDADVLRETLLAERRRAERLADLGLRVVRWTAADLRRPHQLADRITAARQNWDGARFNGAFRLGTRERDRVDLSDGGPTPRDGHAAGHSTGQPAGQSSGDPSVEPIRPPTGHHELPYLSSTPSGRRNRPADPAHGG